MDVDIDTLSDPPSADDDSRFLPESSSPPLKVASKKRKKPTVVSASTKKKLHVIYSDDEASNGHSERDSLDDDLSDIASEASDDDLDLPKRGAPKARAGATKGGAGKANPGQLKGAKAKGLKDREKDKEILMKDERRLGVPPATTSRASSAAAQSQPSDLFSNDDLAPSSAVDPLPDQTIPKKRKLPPIKKTKIAGTATPTATQKPAPAPVQELAKPLLPTSEQRKQALTGVRDIDLADPKAYAELFKGVSPDAWRDLWLNCLSGRRNYTKVWFEKR